MKDIDLIKLLAWLGILAFCALFWIAVLSCKVFLYCVVAVFVVMFFVVRKELK